MTPAIDAARVRRAQIVGALVHYGRRLQFAGVTISKQEMARLVSRRVQVAEDDNVPVPEDIMTKALEELGY